MDDALYESFYGLKEQPFAISTDPRFLFLSASHQRAYQELLTGFQRHEGLMLMTGEAGTGKTTLCRGVIEALGDRTFSAILLNPYMSGAELLKIVLKEFGLVTREELRKGVLARAEPPQLLDAIEGFLLSVRSIDSRAIIVVDEAQSLAPAVLDQVRLLTALERHGKPLLQIIIGGQPKLIETLKKDSMYALNERITRRVHLAPLLADEVQAYILHRLTVAGAAEGVAFRPEATALIAELSRGLPRRVNLLCDRALQEGRSESAKVIDVEMVRRAAGSLAGTQHTQASSDSIADGVPELIKARIAALTRDKPEQPDADNRASELPDETDAVESKAAGAEAETVILRPETETETDTETVILRPEAAADAATEVYDAAALDASVATTPAETETVVISPPAGFEEPASDLADPETKPTLSPKESVSDFLDRLKNEQVPAGPTLLLPAEDAAPEPAADSAPVITLGQTESSSSPARKWILRIGAVALLLGGAGYGYFVTTALAEPTGLPDAPAAPTRAVDPLLEAYPVPDAATLATDLEQFRLLLLMTGGGNPPPF